MRPIDADAIRLPKGFFEEVDNVPKLYEWLNEQPTIDAVPVVRCKDCKHRSSNNDWFETLVCPCECGEYSWNPTDDFFCAYGERSEE